MGVNNNLLCIADLSKHVKLKIMAKSSIEITEKEYLIKLDKAEFEYPLVRKVLNRLLHGNFLGDDGGWEEEVTNRHAPELCERFDFLADK